MIIQVLDKLLIVEPKSGDRTKAIKYLEKPLYQDNIEWRPNIDEFLKYFNGINVISREQRLI